MSGPAHHLAIGRNVPLANVVDWIVSLAPTGIIEFVPKNDPRVQQLLSLRQDVIEDYAEKTFHAALHAALAARARIELSVELSPRGTVSRMVSSVIFVAWNAIGSSYSWVSFPTTLFRRGLTR